MKISDYSIRHPAVITMLIIAVVLFGLISLPGLKQEFIPGISFPQLTVFTVYPGAGPEDVEKEVTEPLEEVFNGIPGVTGLSSTSSDSLSTITLSFDWKIDASDKIPDVREKINGVLGELPEDISGSPSILHISSNALSCFATSIEGDMEAGELTRYVDDFVKPAFSRVTGVARVNLSGGTRKEVLIRVDPFQLQNQGISVLELYKLLEYNNASVPAGSVFYREGSLNLSAQGEFSSLDEIRNTVIGNNDRAFVRVRDVADVEWAPEKESSYSVAGGEKQIVLNVYNQSGTDVVALVKQLKKELRRIEEETGGAVRFHIIANDAENIRLSLNSVQSAALTGGLLAVLVLLLFLHNVRTSLIIAASIPLSILFSLILLRRNGMSLNLMTLGALTLSLGMIVDSSIVLLENIYRHYRKTGDRVASARIGADEMGSAVIASTATSLAVFAPILFLSGFTGEILRDVAWTMLFALGSSMVVAVAVVPYLCSLFLKMPPETSRFPRARRVFSFMDVLTGRLSRGYFSSLRWCLNHKRTVISGAVLLLVLSGLMTTFLAFEFIPSTDMNEFTVTIETPPGSTLEQTRRKAEEVEVRVRELVPEIEALSVGVGNIDFFGLMTQDNRATMRVRLIGNSKRKRDVHAVIEDLRQELPGLVSDVDAVVRNGGIDMLMSAAVGEAGYAVQLEGDHLESLMTAADRVEELMYGNDLIFRVDRNVVYNRQELLMHFNHDAMGILGITPYEAGLASRIFFTGLKAGTLYSDNGNFPIRLQGSMTDQRIDEDIVNIISLKSQMSGETISFASFTDLEQQPGISGIRRDNRVKTITVTAFYEGAAARDISGYVSGGMASLDLPAGVAWRVAGNIAEMIDAFLSLLFVLLISVFLVYSVMVIQFERFAQPLIIMISVPFTFIGVVLGLLLYGTSLNIVSILGVIALAGIVVNNAIVLVDYTNLLRRRDDMALTDAVLKGASSRLQPILMTTLTTLLGIIPLALNTGEGAEIYAPLGQSISGGLISSTLITLYLVPVLYHSFEQGLRKKEIQK